MKTCTNCNESKPIEKFNRDERSKDGLRPWCKACCNDYFRKYRLANPEKTHAAIRRWAVANLDKRRAAARQRQFANPEKRRAADLKYRLTNPEKKRAATRRWRLSHPQKEREYKHRRRARKSGNGGSFTSTEWKLLCEKYDYLCLGCGERKPLEADHIVPIARGGTSDIENIQPLCRFCNSSKGAKTIDYRKEAK